MKLPTCPGARRRGAIAACIMAMLCAAGAARAETGVEFLQKFLQESPDARIVFDQTSLDADGNALSESRGRFWYRRPGLFRMEYDPPENIVMVADGNEVWTYEPDLSQVLVQSSDALSGASLLLDVMASGDLSDLRRGYTLASEDEDGLRWASAVARTRESAIRKMRLAFDPEDGALRRIELVDSFGNAADLEVFLVSRDRTDSSLFRFTPPAGVDIVRE